MNIIILQQAFEELKDAIAYYEEQQSGLGLKFKEEADQHIKVDPFVNTKIFKI